MAMLLMSFAPVVKAIVNHYSSVEVSVVLMKLVKSASHRLSSSPVVILELLETVYSSV